MCLSQKPVTLMAVKSLIPAYGRRCLPPALSCYVSGIEIYPYPDQGRTQNNNQ